MPELLLRPARKKFKSPSSSTESYPTLSKTAKKPAVATSASLAPRVAKTTLNNINKLTGSKSQKKNSPMTHIIIKTSKAKVLYHRDQLVAEATAKKELVSYSDDHVETADGKYVFRVMPVAMPMEVLNQIYDLGNVEGDADVSDIVRTLEADIEKIKKAISQVVKAAPTPAPESPKEELPTFTGNKIEDAPAQPPVDNAHVAEGAEKFNEPAKSADLPVEPATSEQVKEKMDAEAAKEKETEKTDSVS